MDLNIDIERELWHAIEKNYNNENYSIAILDAMHLLTETMRNKTGLEGDGASLVGQSFGGDNPKIQLNKLQTDSEKEIQKGTQEIIKGFYTAIRNPRSHDKIKDTKQETDAIIFFIDYLLRKIDKSKLSFEEETFLKRVFDKYFVKSKEYSDLLVSEIPKRQRANIAISIVLQREKGDLYNLEYFMTCIFDKLEEAEIVRVYKVVSEELKFTSSDEDIRSILHICPAKYWDKIDKVVKIRIENILKENIKSGKYNSIDKEFICGTLGTWIELEHFLKFDVLDGWTSLIVDKIEDGDVEEKNYIDIVFWDKICAANRNEINYSLKKYIKSGLKNKNLEVVKKLETEIMYDQEHPWWKVFEEELKEYPEIKYCELPFFCPIK